MKNTVWIKQLENRSMNCTWEKQIFYFSCKTHKNPLSEKFSTSVFFLPEYVNSLLLLFLFLFSFNVSFRKKPQFWSGLLFWMFKYKISLAHFCLQDMAPCMEWELLEELDHQSTSWRHQQKVKQMCHISNLSLSLCPKSLKLFYINAFNSKAVNKMHKILERNSWKYIFFTLCPHIIKISEGLS